MVEEIGGSWSARVVVPFELTEPFEQAFIGLAGVVSLYEFSEDGKLWAVEGQFAEAPSRNELASRIALAAATAGIAEPELRIVAVPASDWLTVNIASFPALHAGRFFIHGDHIKGPFPPGMIRLEVNAATAFGSGEHESTRGCLLALDHLRKRIPCGAALDMGCGTGILAMAMAKAWHTPVLAADIDPEAVRVTRLNVGRNGVAGLVTTVLSEGCGQRQIRKSAAYDIITANILARPLVHMSRDLTRRLKPGGRLIMAGLLTKHESMVLGAYRAQGLRLSGRIRLKAWSTLILERGRGD
ncbi:MAG: 50S ribosomal protein L11 methyltransferase [Rhodospirillaceae bacterium]